MRFAKTFTGLLTLLALALPAAAQEQYPMSTIMPKTDFAASIHDLYVQIFWWSLGILAVCWVVLAYILIRFRERPDSPMPKQIHGHTGMEIAWTVVPALIVVAIAIPTIQTVFQTQKADPDAFVVDVIGHQYWWEFRYPQNGDVITANELRLPVGKPVSLRIWSDDVIHSFWIPMLGGKRDANPLRVVPEGETTHYSWIHMTPQETGYFLGQCAEFCGDSHSRMMMAVIVDTEEGFEQWLDDWRTGHAAPGTQVAAAEPGADADMVAMNAGGPQDATGPAAPAETVDPRVMEGYQLFMGQCVACHGVPGDVNVAASVAPDLTLLGRRERIGAGMLENTPENLVRWIKDPRAIKPGVLMPGQNYAGGRAPIVWPAFPYSDAQIESIAHYLTSLR